jgi:hypothetical protein
MVYAATTFKYTFDYQDDDIYWFVLGLFIAIWCIFMALKDWDVDMCIVSLAH